MPAGCSLESWWLVTVFLKAMSDIDLSSRILDKNLKDVRDAVEIIRSTILDRILKSQNLQFGHSCQKRDLLAIIIDLRVTSREIVAAVEREVHRVKAFSSEFIYVFGVPKTLHTDHEANFKSNLMRNFATCLTLGRPEQRLTIHNRAALTKDLTKHWSI
ncbi:hypothetical protein RF11_02734 [Thelohanellus kitauei]|uniref:Uncharacterized protein n=1 Tax=Thelohanellus kitauei TaxID=669202 RepID=A0A0C2IIZ1_THEKT|nr:hypothetical protein RF11_02734 [Thelohanellus kitauei]